MKPRRQESQAVLLRPEQFPGGVLVRKLDVGSVPRQTDDRFPSPTVCLGRVLCVSFPWLP